MLMMTLGVSDVECLDTNVKQATSRSGFVFVLPHKSCGITRRQPKSLVARRPDRCATPVCELRRPFGPTAGAS